MSVTMQEVEKAYNPIIEKVLDRLEGIEQALTKQGVKLDEPAVKERGPATLADAIASSFDPTYTQRHGSIR